MKKYFKKSILLFIVLLLLFVPNIQAEITNKNIKIPPVLNLNTNGYVSSYNSYNYYSFYVPEKMTISITGSSSTYTTCELMDDKSNVLQKGYSYSNYSITKTLDKGYYKLKIKKYDYYSGGSYNINIAETYRYPRVIASHKSGAYEGGISLELSPNTTGASVYYNMNASSDEDVLYTEPLNITTSSSISCFVRKHDGTTSAKTVFEYVILPEVKEIIIPNEKTLVLGEEFKIPVRVYPEEGRTDDLVWSSSDSNVVQVLQDGLIRANTTGQAIIFLQKKDSDIKDSCNITVVDSLDGNLIFDIKDAVGESGDEVVIPITVDQLQGSGIGIDGFQFAIDYDLNRLEFVDASIGSIVLNQEHLSYREKVNGKIRFFYANSTPKRKSIIRNGVMINLRFKIKDDVLEGNADILFSSEDEHLFIDRNMNKLNTILKGGFVDIRNYLFGDINEDNMVDNEDFNILKNYLLGDTSLILTDSEKRAADVDKNGTIDILDSMYIQRYILGMIKEFPGEWIK